jgi:hypothetical protein
MNWNYSGQELFSYMSLEEVTVQVGHEVLIVTSGNIEGGNITVPLTSCLTGLESAV